MSARLTTLPNQNDRLEINELFAAMAQLTVDQREALLLVTAEGLSYEEAAAIAGCAVGTIKSRINRARGRLAELMGLSAMTDFGVEGQLQAALASAAQLHDV